MCPAATIGNINEDVTNIKQQIVEYVNTAQEAQRTIELPAKVQLFIKYNATRSRRRRGGPVARRMQSHNCF